MAKRILIPKDLWFFVGRELSSMGHTSEISPKISTIEEPMIRWLLLENEEWQTFWSQLNSMNLNHEHKREMKEKSEEIGDYLSLYVKETLKRKDILEQFPETIRMIVEKGFIGFDNVILMSESKTEELFKEASEECFSRFGKPLIFSIDSFRLAVLIRELIHIYRFRLGKLFTGKEFGEGILENKILLRYLGAHSSNPKDFKLDVIRKSNQQEFIEEQIRQNIWKALNQKQPSILRDNNGKEIGVFNVGKLFSIEEGEIHVNFGVTGLKTKRSFVGMGHILYNPELFGARNVQEVLDSWDWLIKKIQISEETLQMALEACSLSILLLTGRDEGENVYIFSLFVDLHELDSMGIDTSPKIEEFGHQIRSHMREFEKWIDKRPWRAFFKTQKLRQYLSNVSSECRLARLAKFYGFDVKFRKHPDLLINGKKIEVKRLSSYDEYASLSNPIEEGLSQPHDIIAIEVNSLKQREIPNHKSTWLGKGDLKKNLETALACERKGSIVLLFMGTAKSLEGRIILLED